MIENSKELWLRLSRLAQFDDTAYDRELKNTIAQRLNLGPGDIAYELKRCGISNEALLTAVLEAMQPFSQMMADLLRTYETAGAFSNENNIQIVFDFNGVPAEYSLNAFRKQVRHLQERLSVQTELLEPWALIDVLKNFDGSPLPITYREWENGEKRKDYLFPKEIQNWLNDYKADKLPDHLPSFPEVLDRELNARLRKVQDLAESSLQQYYREYNPSVGLRETIRRGREKYNSSLWKAEGNCWLGNFVCTYCLVASYFRNLPPSKHQRYLVWTLDEFFASNAVKQVTIRDQYDALHDILDMPFWKHRYEMYSAWVFTCISDAVSDLGLSYNVENGVLSFRFSGSLLATLHLPGAVFEIWAEKRHPAVNPEGSSRKFNIQPDYSIVKRCDDTRSTCLIIECKQYKRSNNINFANAVNDYALACQSAKVLLANYGRISKSMTKRLKPTVLNRYKGYSSMRPGEPKRDEFCQDVREAIETNWIDAQPERSEDIILWEDWPEQIQIELSWDVLPQDLDLEVKIKDVQETTICYYRMGRLDKYPYAKLNQDIRSGPGTEKIKLGKIVAGEYKIFVNNYSGEEQITGEIHVRVRSGEEVVCFTKKGTWAKDERWYVGAVNAIGVTKADVMQLRDE